jgi:hypothetical protein
MRSPHRTQVAQTNRVATERTKDGSSKKVVNNRNGAASCAIATGRVAQEAQARGRNPAGEDPG